MRNLRTNSSAFRRNERMQRIAERAAENECYLRQTVGCPALLPDGRQVEITRIVNAGTFIVEYRCGDELGESSIFALTPMPHLSEQEQP